MSGRASTAALTALLVTAPALVHVWDGTLDPAAALLRFVVALVVCATGASLLRDLTTSYSRANARKQDAEADSGDPPPGG